jgi:putative DNA primase/helicase
MIRSTVRTDIWNYLFDQTYAINQDELEEQNTKYLTLQNCLLNLDTQETIDHTSEVFTTNCLEFDYIPSASPAPFIKYLVSTFDKDKEIIKYIQEVLGYIFYKGLPRPAMFFFKGKPGTGKSTFLDIIQLLVGKQNCSFVSLKDMKSEHYRSTVKDKLVNICSETPPNTPIDENIMKGMSDGSDVQARNLYSSPFDFRPYAKQYFGMNEFPNFVDNTSALYDRIYLITFNHRFRATKEETLDLANKFEPKDLSGILNWCLKGLKKLKENNFMFSVPETMVLEKEFNKMDNDPEYSFFKDCIRKSTGSKLKMRYIYKRYENYIEGNFDIRKKRSLNELRKRLEGFGLHWYKPNNVSSMRGVDWTDEADAYKDYDEG